MRLHLASAAAGLRPSATPARRPRRRLPGTTGLRFALYGRQRLSLAQKDAGGVNASVVPAGEVFFIHVFTLSLMGITALLLDERKLRHVPDILRLCPHDPPPGSWKQ